MSNGEETGRQEPMESQEPPHSREEELKELRRKLKAAETAKKQAEQRFIEQEQSADKAKKKARDARQSLEALTKEQDARRGLREFIQHSLSDILTGADDAAISARDRQLDGGLDESGFITPGKIGSPSAAGRESTVEFDVAVVAGHEATHQKGEGKDRDLKAGVSFMDVIPLGFSVQARSVVRSEKRSEVRRDVNHHNRIRFAVPITFASLEEPEE